MNIQLITDSSSDIPEEWRKSKGIEVVPLYIHFGEDQYRSGIDIDQASFIRKMRSVKEFPRSSAPSPNDFLNAYEQISPEKPILVLTLSKGLSSTYQHAQMAKEMLLEKEPDRKIAVINSRTASSGLILLLDEAGQKIDQGVSFEELIPYMEERIEKTATLFILKTLENVIRGGRLDRVKGTIAKTMNIKLLLKASSEGKIDVAEKVRGDKKSITRFVDQIGEYTEVTENKTIVMTHCNAEDRAKEVMDKIKQKYTFKQSMITEMGPLISTYAGEGGLVISFFEE